MPRDQDTFAGFGWHVMVPARMARPLWAEMPLLNRYLTALGGACLLLALGRVTVPPAAQGVRQALYPYTTAGRQEICASHLRSVAQAMAAYAQDNDGLYPPLDYQNAPGKRLTWVSMVSGRTAENGLLCPAGPNLPAGKTDLLSSYAMNPVLATGRASEMEEASAALLLADGGGKHDVSLLPPYPSWPSYALRRADGSVDAVQCNFDFRHGGQAGAAYLDGHASMLRPGSWATDAASWGGSAVLRRSGERLAQRGPAVRELFQRLQADDVSGAATSLVKHRAALKPISQEVQALWRLNSGAHTSDSVEKLGWNLAHAWKRAGDTSFEKQCDEEQTRRSAAEAQRVDSGSWEQRTTPGQPGIRCQAPSFWSAQEEQEGRYKRLYVRSLVPAVFAVLEVGSRTRYVTPQPINWGGEERDLQQRYGVGNYRRVNLVMDTLSGHAASILDYEVEKPGGPRLHKRLVGYTDGLTSYVLSCSAPARDWELWKPVFIKMLGSASTGYLAGE